MRRLLPLLSLLLPSVPAAQTLEIRTAPVGRIYLHEVHRGAGVHDFVVQNVAIVNRSQQQLTLQSVRFEVFRRDQVVLAQYLPTEILEPQWRFLRGYLERPGVMLSQRSTFLFDELLKDSVTLASTLTLAPGSAVIIARRPFVTSFLIPDRMRISASAATASGGSVAAQVELTLTKHASPNEYRFPLSGRWYVASSGSLQSHHRWRPSSEFALDLTRIGEDSKSHRGDGTRPTDYYAYGSPVLAIAPGRVIAITNDVADNEFPRPNETRPDFARRVLTPLWERDPSGKLASGNVIVIEHPGSEFSSYVHLRRGSVRVAVGDSVRAGQQIAEIGFSGDGFEPHLHFQITRGPDPNFSPGLPVNFANIRPVGFSSTIDTEPRRHLLTGEFIETINGVRPH